MTAAKQELAELVSEIDLIGRNSHKYDALAAWASQRFNMPGGRINGTYLAESKKVTPRLTQGAGRSPVLLWAFVGDAYPVEAFVQVARGHVGPGRANEACAVCRLTPDGWAVSHLLSAPSWRWRGIMRTEFPEAQSIDVEGALEATNGVGRDQLALRAVPELPRIELDDRTRRMIRLAIASNVGVLLVGPPGTGKTTLLHEIVADARSDPAAYGLSTPPPGADWYTPDESWTARELVGGETIVDGELRFGTGHLLNALERGHWLVLDEANRGDMDRIMGPLITWISGNEVSLGRVSRTADASEILLGWSNDALGNAADLERLGSDEVLVGSAPIRVEAGRDWRLLGAYNALDAQRVFRFGQALGRRFIRVPIPPLGGDAFRDALEARAPELPTHAKGAVAALYEAHLDSPLILGPAILLRAADYLAAAEDFLIDEPAPDGSSGGPPDGRLRTLIAEAYLLSAGPWLARLDDAHLAELRAAIAAQTTVLDDAAWDWLQRLLPALG